MKTPAVTVLLPVHNAERYAAAAVESILRQTFTDFECLIIDDGSTDGSCDVLRAVVRNDARIVITSRPNRGLVETLNEGLARARGEFVARMDADDISLSDRFETQVAYLRAHQEVVAVGSAVQTIDAEGCPVGCFHYPLEHDAIDATHCAAKGGAIPHPAAMLRTVAMRSIGGYRQAFRHAEDVDLFLRLAEIGRLANLPGVHFVYRQHLASVSHRHAAAQARAAAAAAMEACARRGILPPPRIAVAEKTPGPCEVRAKWAWWALGEGHLSTARKHALGAFIRKPWDISLWRLGLCAARGH